MVEILDTSILIYSFNHQRHIQLKKQMESYLRQCNLEQQIYLTAANQIRTLNLFLLLLLLLLGAFTILSLNITIGCVFYPLCGY